MSALAAVLLVQPAAAETIVVTGRGLPDTPPGQHRLVLDEQLDRAASGRMESVLRDIAGLTSFRRSDARSSHPTAQGLTARGLGGNAASRFGVEVDGVPQADPFGGWINFVALDPVLTDRLVVARGGQGAVRFGQGAVAGTIAIDSLATGIAPGAGFSVGSRGSVAAWARGSAALGAGRLAGGVSLQRGDGFAPIVDKGPVDGRAPFAQVAARVRAVIPIAGGELQAGIAAFDDQRSRGTDFTANRGQGLDFSLRLVGSDWSVAGWMKQRRFASEFASVGAGRATVGPALDQVKVPAAGWGARGEWRPTLGPFALALGGDLRAATGRTDERFAFVAGRATRAREAAARTLTAGLFADAGWRRGGTEIGFGARFDHWRIEDAALDERTLAGTPLTALRFPTRDGRQWSLRGGIEQRIGGALTVRAAAYRGWRLPTINELVRPFRVGPDATAANAALAPERLVGAEAGLDWRPAEGARLSLTAYANRLKGAVANVTLGQGPGVFAGVGFVAAGGLYRRRENLGAIVARGIELDGEWRSGPWSLSGSLALTRARIRDDGLAAAFDGERPAQVPTVQASLGGAWSQRGRLAALTVRHIGRQNEAEGDARPLPAAWTADAVVRWPLTGRLTLDLRAENLTDARVVTSILADGTRERATPRTLWLGLRVE